MKLKEYLKLINTRPSDAAEALGHHPAVITEYLNTEFCTICRKELGRKNLSLPIALKIQAWSNGLVRCEDLLMNKVFTKEEFDGEVLYFCSQECHLKWVEGS